MMQRIFANLIQELALLSLVFQHHFVMHQLHLHWVVHTSMLAAHTAAHTAAHATTHTTTHTATHAATHAAHAAHAAVHTAHAAAHAYQRHIRCKQACLEQCPNTSLNSPPMSSIIISRRPEPLDAIFA